MNARDQLLGVLTRLHGWHPDQANTLIDDYAHELAEQIREDTTVMGEAGDQYALLYADLIDPEVQRTNTSKEPTP
jgi:hypothetical protein